MGKSSPQLQATPTLILLLLLQSTTYKYCIPSPSSHLRDKQKQSTQQLLQSHSSYVPSASIVLSLYSAAASIAIVLRARPARLINNLINFPLWKRSILEKHNFGNIRIRKSPTLEIIKFGKAQNCHYKWPFSATVKKACVYASLLYEDQIKVPQCQQRYIYGTVVYYICSEDQLLNQRFT